MNFIVYIMEKTLIFNFFLGFICSIGFYPLFYKLNRPSARWRSITLLSVVVLSRPLCLLWQSIYLEHGQNNTAILMGIAFILDILSLLCFILLGANRLRMIVAAAFVYSVISIAQIPSVYFIAFVIHPIINTPNLYEMAALYPQLFYSGLFLNNIIITVCCLFVVRWFRETQIKPPYKICMSFSLMYVLFALVVLLWFSDIIKIMSISFLVSALIGTFLVGILLLLFYLYTRLVLKTDNISVIKNPNVGEYIQFINQLSKRELEVIEAVLSGNDSHKQLSTVLNISVNTVKTHLKHIYSVTGISSIDALSMLFRGYIPDHP